MLVYNKQIIIQYIQYEHKYNFPLFACFDIFTSMLLMKISILLRCDTVIGPLLIQESKNRRSFISRVLAVDIYLVLIW